MCYNIIVKRNGKEQNKKIKKVLKSLDKLNQISYNKDTS